MTKIQEFIVTPIHSTYGSGVETELKMVTNVKSGKVEIVVSAKTAKRFTLKNAYQAERLYDRLNTLSLNIEDLL